MINKKSNNKNNTVFNQKKKNSNLKNLKQKIKNQKVHHLFLRRLPKNKMSVSIGLKRQMSTMYILSCKQGRLSGKMISCTIFMDEEATNFYC